MYERTASDECAIEWSLNDLTKAFASFSDMSAIYRMRRDVVLQPGYIVFLKENVFQGLQRYGEVLTTRGTHILVRHIVQPSVTWRLPQHVLAGKHKRCKFCRVRDDPRCENCIVVPFPLIYACRDISASEEFLCLYSSEVKARGLPCRSMLDEESMSPCWNEVYDTSFTLF